MPVYGQHGRLQQLRKRLLNPAVNFKEVMMLFYVMKTIPDGYGGSCRTRHGRSFKSETPAKRLADKVQGWVEEAGKLVYPLDLDRLKERMH